MNDSDLPRRDPAQETRSAQFERKPLDRTKPPREWRSRPRERPARAGGAIVPRRASPKTTTPASRLHERPPAHAAPSSAEPRDATHVEADFDRAGVDEVSVDRTHDEHAQDVRVDGLPMGMDADAIPELPTHYGVDRLVLLIRDPHWCYAWWEVTDAQLQSARRELDASAQLVLRFYDITAIEWDGHNHHISHDIDIDSPHGNWYVELGRPGASFVAEIGWRTADGRFRPLVRSNYVALPRDSMSSEVDENWMVLEHEYRKLFELAGGEGGRSSAEFLRTLEERLRRELLSGGVSSFGVSSFAARRTR